ncbi:MAG TPA: hypothetical protein VEM57_04245 [Candidatus Binatus sp.]|nr:hypothetical protein [Candidatus Binatus sp.]
MRRYGGLLLFFLVTACSPSRPQVPSGQEGRALYTCCTLSFDLGRYASDANYEYRTYREAVVLPVGTRVRVTEDHGNMIEFEPEGMVDSFRLAFKFGKARMTAAEWFHLILVEDDPRLAVSRMPADAAAAITEGRLAIGMTKPQAIMARGYPPFHRTAGVESDDWLYYASPGFVDRVIFTEGRIASVNREDAPK